MKKLYSIIGIIIFLSACGPSPEDAINDACDCLNTILEKERISKADYENCYDSCANIVKNKYKDQQEDDDFVKKANALEYKMKEIYNKIVEKYNSQVFTIDLFEFISQVEEYDQGYEMIDMNIQISGLLLIEGTDRNGNYVLELIAESSKNGYTYLMTDFDGEFDLNELEDFKYGLQNLIWDQMTDYTLLDRLLSNSTVTDFNLNKDIYEDGKYKYVNKHIYLKPINSKYSGTKGQVICKFKNKPNANLNSLCSEPIKVEKLIKTDKWSGWGMSSDMKFTQDYMINYNLYSFKQKVTLNGRLKNIDKIENDVVIILENCEIVKVESYSDEIVDTNEEIEGDGDAGPVGVAEDADSVDN